HHLPNRQIERERLGPLVDGYGGGRKRRGRGTRASERDGRGMGSRPRAERCRDGGHQQRDDQDGMGEEAAARPHGRRRLMLEGSPYQRLKDGFKQVKEKAEDQQKDK